MGVERLNHRWWTGLLAALVALFALAGFTATAKAASNNATQIENSCATAPAGYVRCDAEVLVYKRNHQLVHKTPKQVKAQTQTQSGRRAALVSTADRARVVSAPQAFTPAYLQAAYDLTALSANAGYNDTIAVIDVGNDPTAASDMATFRSTYGLPSCTAASGCFQKLNEYGQASPLPAVNTNWTSEESLDLDAISAICPHCRILLMEVDSGSVGEIESAMRAAAAAGAKQISASFSLTAAFDPFANFTLPGVSIVAATGDNGVNSVNQDSYPAADPNVTAVGGTTLVTSSAGKAGARGVSENVWTGTGVGAGAGCDTAVSKLSYQPTSACTGRLYADVSADADPNTGLYVYDSFDGGWLQAGGTSLATPIVAATEALIGVDSSSPKWVYSDDALNAVGGGVCSKLGQVLCSYDGSYQAQVGMGTVSGAAVTGAPGIALPSYGASGSYVSAWSATTATLRGGVYSNNESTTYSWQYGTTTSYGSQTPAGTVAAGTTANFVTNTLRGLRANTTYHYRLVATNANGTTYGYDYTFTTARSAAQVRAAAMARKRAAARAARARAARAARARAARIARARAARARAARVKG